MLRFLYSCLVESLIYIFFFFNDTATTEIYTLSLHDALPIYKAFDSSRFQYVFRAQAGLVRLSLVRRPQHEDRKSTRLNSSHSQISYAVFCLKKKKPSKTQTHADLHAHAVRRSPLKCFDQLLP